MKTRWKMVIAAGAFVTLMVAGLLLNSHYQPSNAVEAYMKSLRERGEKLDLDEVLPPPVPEESNCLAVVQDAFRLFVPGDIKNPAAMKMVAPGKALVGWQQPEVRGYDFTNSWADFSSYVTANRPGIELLHQVLERPRLDFNLDYSRGASLPLPHLVGLKHAAQILESATVADLHNGDPGLAVTNILISLALVQRNAAEGLLISHLVRIAIASIAVTPTWELLQATNVTDAQLAGVQAGWTQMDFLGDATNAFAVERAWGVNEIQKLRAMSHEDLAAEFGISGSGSSSSGGSGWEAITEKPRAAIGEFMWRSSWSYADELRTLKSESIMLEALRQMQTNRIQNYKVNLDDMQSRLSALGITNTGEAFFKALDIPNFGEAFGNWDLSSSVRKTVRLETVRRVVVVAIALKRFQIRHGKLPVTLKDLVPEFLLAVPLDPNDGQALRYRANADGTFLLYSVGADGNDDGGDPTIPAASEPNLSWQNEKARDWVWPQPATALEIQMYYEDEAKRAK
jgi:hypothetical protein